MVVVVLWGFPCHFLFGCKESRGSSAPLGIYCLLDCGFVGFPLHLPFLFRCKGTSPVGCQSWDYRFSQASSVPLLRFRKSLSRVRIVCLIGGKQVWKNVNGTDRCA